MVLLSLTLTHAGPLLCPRTLSLSPLATLTHLSPHYPIKVGSVTFDRQGIADHATQLAKSVQGNLQRSLEAIGVVSRSLCLFLYAH